MDPIRSDRPTADYGSEEIRDPWQGSKSGASAAPPKLDPLLVDPWAQGSAASTSGKVGPFEDPWAGRRILPPKLDPALVEPWKRSAPR